MLGSIYDRLARRAGRADRGREWERRGIVGPLRVLPRSHAARIGRHFREQYARSCIASTLNRHVDLPVLAELCANANIWPPAHDILGDELLLWRTRAFLGIPTLLWHEDRHARLFVNDAFSLSMLLAIDASPPDNCTVFIPGSHKLTIAEKEDRYGVTATDRASGNVAYEGRIAGEFREPVPLRAGEMILFHPELLHASSGFVNGGNPQTRERMNIGFRVTTPDVELREAAFPVEREERELVLRAVRRSSGTME